MGRFYGHWGRILMAHKRYCWVLLIVLACGTGGDPGSGAKNLPNPGFSPYTVHRDAMNETIGLLKSGGYGSPFARVEGESVALYVHRCIEDDCRIFRTHSDDGVHFDDPTQPFPTLTDVRDPFVYSTTRGDVMYVVNSAHTQLLRISLLTPNRSTVLYSTASDETVHEPSAVTIQGDTKVFGILKRNGQRQLVQFSEDGPQPVSFALCTDSDEACWARGELFSAEVRGLRTQLGEMRYRLLFSIEGTAGQQVLGFAQSADGYTWRNFPFNPSVESSSSLGSSTHIRFGQRYFIYGEAGRRNPRVMAAINDQGWPSMVWDRDPGPGMPED